MKELLNCHGKLLGVDFGDKRTGLAVSNREMTVASGLRTVSPGGLQKTAEAVAEVAREVGAVGIAVGLPVNMDGSFGPRAERCRAFAEELSRQITRLAGPDAPRVPVVTVDERMTTMAAARYLDGTDTRGAKRKAVIDTLSAQIILQNTLDRLGYLRREEEGNR